MSKWDPKVISQPDHERGPADQSVFFAIGKSAPSEPEDTGMVTQSKRETVIRRILHTVKQYTDAHGPIPISILSAKYSRLCGDIGGFPELMMELEDTGLLDVEVTKTGRQLVSIGKKKRIPKALF
jgi:hypothetical protein